MSSTSATETTKQRLRPLTCVWIDCGGGGRHTIPHDGLLFQHAKSASAEEGTELMGAVRSM